MIEKNSEYIVTITGYTSEGYGVGRVDGFVVFVPFSIEGEEVNVHIIKVDKTFAVGKIVQIIKPSPDRVEPPCKYFSRCGGCKLEHVSGEHALEIKRKIVEDALTKIGGFENINVKNTIKSDKNYNYRNKSAFPVVGGKVCMFRELSHEAIFIDECLLANDMTNKAAACLNDFLKMSPFEAKFLVTRWVEGKLLVVIVASKKPHKLDDFFIMLKERLGLSDDKVGLYFLKKQHDNNVILEGELSHIGGIKSIVANINGIEIEISPMSFFQVNGYIMGKIYEDVIQTFDKSDIVVDAYSGAGLMSAMLARRVKEVYGIEIVKEATSDAETTKARNKLLNLTNINGDSKLVLPKLSEKLKNFSLIIDPPRKGVDKAVCECIVNAKPKKIVYVSCEPASLARDLKIICSGGYKIDSVQPYDMFPQTSNVETVVKLSRV